MPTLDCYAARLDEERADATQARRPITSSASWCQAKAARPSADETFEWSQHDVFTIPHWTFARHEALGGDADLFMVTDKSAFERLDLVREEFE